MGDHSKIEWTDATWNPVTGCTKVSQGCKNCYAERLAPKVFAGQRVLEVFADSRGRVDRPRLFTDVIMQHDRLEQPLHWRKPRRIFVNSMSDLFHEDIPFEFIDKVFAVMALSHRHTFQVLTKRADRMREYLTAARATAVGMEALAITLDERLKSDRSEVGKGVTLTGHVAHLKEWPLPNVWFGVSVEDQATADERILLLRQTPAYVRFLSCEPLLGPMDIARHLIAKNIGGPGEATTYGIDWVIAGGESGPKARPSHPDWFRSLRDQCAVSGVPFFFKQWGEWAPRVEWSGHQGRGKFGHMVAIMRDGGDCPFDAIPQDVGAQRMAKVGKKAAGRLLDGRAYHAYPTSHEPSATHP